MISVPTAATRANHPDRLRRFTPVWDEAARPRKSARRARKDHGVMGLMRTLALELAPDFIRVDSVHPTSVNTGMVHNAATYALFAPDLPENQGHAAKRHASVR